jgi:hypothetical protein
MRKLITIVLALLLAASACSAQIMGVGDRKVFSVTWSVVQYVSNVSCAANACSITGVNVAAGDLLILTGASATGASTSFSSASGGGATWTHCPSSAAQFFDAAYYATDCAYVLASPAMSNATLTYTIANSGTYYGGDVQLVEVHRSVGTATYDTGGGNTPTGCTSCSGAMLTLSGKSDYILSITAATITSSGPNAPWNSPYDYSIAGAVNMTSGAPVVWPFPSASDAAISEVAFK